MLDSFIISLLMGVLLGFLSGLGIGGGSLLILWLTLVLGMPHETARTVNLMFFLPAAAVAILCRCRQGTYNWKIILPSLAAGIAGALLLGAITKDMNTELLQKPYGILLLVTGIRELFYTPKK